LRREGCLFPLFSIIPGREVIKINIAIIGCGTVGNALKKTLEKYKEKISVYDPFKGFKDDISLAEIIFITVPTNDIEHEVLDEAITYVVKHNKYGLIAIKSTVKPGTTDYYYEKYRDDKRDFAFVPEFLRENSALNDSLKPDKIVIGAYNIRSVQLIKQAFSGLITEYQMIAEGKVLVMKPIEAELAKIGLNSLAMLKVVYANELYDICKAYEANYELIYKVFELDQNINSRHLQPLIDSYRGAGGKCLRKDSNFLIDAGMKKSETPNTLLTAQKINEIYLKETGYDFSGQ